MRTLCCGKATPGGPTHCMPIAICAEWLRKYAASRIAGPPWCDRNAAGRWRRAPGSGAHRNCDVRRIARGIIRTQRATRGAAPAIATALLRDQRARTCKSHLVRSRNLGTCHVHRALGVGGVMLSAAGSQCTWCNKKIGLRLRWMRRAVCNRWWMSSVTRGKTGRMARKKNGGRSNRCDHRDRADRAAYLVARRAYLLRIDICGLSLPSLPGCTVKKYSGFHHAPAAHQVQPSHTSLFFSM